MPTRPVKPGPPQPSRPSRRDFLRATAAVVLGAARFPSGVVAQQAATSSASTRGPVAESAEIPWWMGAGYRKSRVVEVHSADVFDEGLVNDSVLSEMLGMGVLVLTGAATPADGWRTVLGSSKRIVLKFNQVGADTLGTTEVMAGTIVKALVEAEYDPGQVALAEVPRGTVSRLAARHVEPGWGRAIPVGQRREELAKYLLQADAIINVPFLKTHQIAGMSGAMKNLAYAVIRHPARYHANACSPYVGQIIGNKEVSSKLRLNVVNALRVVVRNGPDARRADTVEHGALLIGFDPVATDTVGHEALLTLRRSLGIKGRCEVPYLAAAAEVGVGRRAPHALERKRIAHDT